MLSRENESSKIGGAAFLLLQFWILDFNFLLKHVVDLMTGYFARIDR